jgi:SpoVK/Ycf46/Vps4 family AAA+-type ATPase
MNRLQTKDIIKNVGEINLLKIEKTLKTYVYDDLRQDTSITPTEGLPQQLPTLQDTLSLDSIQQVVYNKVKHHLQQDGHSDPLLLLLHGGPGTGKSTLYDPKIWV